jgi:hypothetical protein
VQLPVRQILLGEVGVVDDQHVLGVSLLCSVGEVEAAGDDSFAIDHHHFVVLNGVLGVDLGRNRLCNLVAAAVLLCREAILVLTAVEDDVHVNATRTRRDDGFGDWLARHLVGHDEDALFGVGDFVNRRSLSAAIWGEIHGRRGCGSNASDGDCEKREGLFHCSGGEVDKLAKEPIGFDAKEGSNDKTEKNEGEQSRPGENNRHLSATAKAGAAERWN